MTWNPLRARSAIRAAAILAFPQGSLWRERPPRRGGVSGGPKGGPLTLPRWRTSAQKAGGRSLHQHPSRAAPGEGGHARRSLASLFRMGRGKSVLSRVLCGVSEKTRTPTARAPPSEREALWLSKACATCVRHQVFFSGALIRRHRLDPQRRKLSIIPRSLGEPVSCSDSSPRLRGTGP